MGHQRPARGKRAQTYEPCVAYGVELRPGTEPLWLYLRLSKVHAKRDGADAIERHRLDLKRKHADGPYTVVGEFTDNESASSYGTRQRKGWLALNEAIEGGDVRAVAFYALSRVTRSTVGTLQWLDWCREQGVRLFSLTDSDEELKRATAGAKMVTGVKALVAEIEADTASERQLAAKEHTAEAGLFHGGTVPLGWMVGPRETDAHGRSGKRLIAHPVEFPALCAAVDWALAGDSMATIARRWVDEFGITSADGKPVYQATVLRALRSPRLMGYRMRQVPEHERGKKVSLMDFIVRDGRGEPVISQPPVCDSTSWTRLQATLTQRSNVDTRRPWGSHEWLLSGLLVCAECQGRLYGHQKITRGGERTFSYRCMSNRTRGVGTCSGSGVHGPNVEAFVLGWVVEHLSSERLSEAAVRQAQPRVDNARETGLAEARAERDLLIARQQAGEFRGSLLGIYMDLLNDAQGRIDRLEGQAGAEDMAPLELTGQDLLTSWPDLAIDRRRHVLRRVVKEVKVSKGRQPLHERLDVVPRW